MTVHSSYLNSRAPLSTLVIGFSGGRGKLYAQCAAEHEGFRFDGVVKSRRELDLTEFPIKPRVYENLTEALQGPRKWDVAIVSVPHSAHDTITRALIEVGVKLIIKEKPLAISLEFAQEYSALAERKGITMITTTQRQIQPSFLKGLEMLSRIGEIHHFDYLYHFALPEVTSGWRGEKELAIGGVLLDMGYHALDMLHLYFGVMTEASGKLSYMHKEMAQQELEDKAEIELTFGSAKGLLSIDRHALHRQELFKIEGSEGTLEVRPTETILYNKDGQEIERYTPPELDKLEQINLLFERSLAPEHEEWRRTAFLRSVETVAAIEKIYKQTTIVPYE